MLPYSEISVTIYRHAYPRNAFRKLKELGAVIEEKFPRVYYVKGNGLFFPVQILVGRELDPKEYAMFRVLVPDAGDEDIRMFKNMAMKNRAAAYQESVDAVFQVSVSVNKETYARLRREDPDMYEALKELMKDEFIATEEKGIAIGQEQGDRNRIMQLVRKKMAKNKSFEQIVEECEATPEEIRPIYNRLLSEFQN